jgi:hypothetical protein
MFHFFNFNFQSPWLVPDPANPHKDDSRFSNPHKDDSRFSSPCHGSPYREHILQRKKSIENEPLPWES